MNKIKKIIFSLLLVVMMLPVSLVLTACGKDYAGTLDSLKMSVSKFHSTKTTYYVGDEFSPASTFVQLNYLKKGERLGYEISYPLTSLKNDIPDIEYEISGFDSSKVVDSQEITIKISSPTYKNELQTSFKINILPEYIVESEIADETVIKEQYILNEELDYTNLKIKNTYSNGREELVNVTAEMVSGFDTSTITAKKRRLEITYNEKLFKFFYVVAPSADFVLLDTEYLNVLVPTEALGYTESVKKEIYYTYTNGTISKLEIGCYQDFSHTEYYLKNFYLNTGSFGQSNVNIVSYETKTINGIEATVCKYSYTGSARVYTGIWFDITQLGNSTGKWTVEVLYYGNALTQLVIDTVMKTISK